MVRLRKAPFAKIKVAALSNYIADNTQYHHGDKCLADTIIAMAHRFVGANNLPYFKEDGQFGTRNMGGKDAAETRYANTRNEWWWHLVFKKDDEPLLVLNVDEGKFCEPVHLLPILPMHVINGAEGIGTGHSTWLPKHNPLDVCAWLLAKLNGKVLPPILPWYRDFTGEVKVAKRSTGEVKPRRKRAPKKEPKLHDDRPIHSVLNGPVVSSETVEIEEPTELTEPTESSGIAVEDSPLDPDHIGDEEDPTDTTKQKERLSVITTGKFELSGKGKIPKVIITELPVGRFTHKYKEWLDKMYEQKQITGFKNHSKHNTVSFEIMGFKNPSIKTLKLQKSYGLSNMVMLDSNKRPVKFDSVSHMLETFYLLRLPYYQKRKEHILKGIRAKIALLKVKSTFIDYVLQEKLEIRGRVKKELFEDMIKLGFDETIITNADLLKSVNSGNFSKDEIADMLHDINLKIEHMTAVEKFTPEQMWITDINDFVAAYCKQYKCKFSQPTLSLNIVK